MFTRFVIRIRRIYTLLFSFLNKENVVVNLNFTESVILRDERNIFLVIEFVSVKFELTTTFVGALFKKEKTNV